MKKPAFSRTFRELSSIYVVNIFEDKIIITSRREKRLHNYDYVIKVKGNVLISDAKLAWFPPRLRRLILRRYKHLPLIPPKEKLFKIRQQAKRGEKQAVFRVYGNSGKLATKTLAEVSQANDATLSVHWLLKGVLPHDVIYKIRNPHENIYGHILPEYVKSIRKSLRRLPRETVIRLMQSPISDLFDTMNMFNAIFHDNLVPLPLEVRRCQSIEELHELLIRLWHQRIRNGSEGNTSVSYTPLELQRFSEIQKRLSESDEGELSLSLAKDTAELEAWGSQMHNCIFSYGVRAVRKEIFLIAVRKGGAMLYNLELSRDMRRVIQLTGKCNRMAEERHARAIELAL